MKNKAGFTLVEVLVAAVVMGTATLGVMSMLQTGDRIKARQIKLAYAAGLAQNEAERIKNIAKSSVIIADTEYEQTVNGLTFSLLRTVIEPESVAVNSTGKIQEIQISILQSGIGDTLSKFRLVQGAF